MSEERLKKAEALLRRYYEYAQLPIDQVKVEVFIELEADILAHCENYLITDTASPLKLVVQQEIAKNGLTVISQEELVTDSDQEKHLLAFSNNLKEASDVSAFQSSTDTQEPKDT